MTGEDPIPGCISGNLVDITSNLKFEPGMIIQWPAHSKLFAHVHDLGEWAYANEAAITEALRMVINRLPLSEISKFERALDALPKGNQ